MRKMIAFAVALSLLAFASSADAWEWQGAEPTLPSLADAPPSSADATVRALWCGPRVEYSESVTPEAELVDENVAAVVPERNEYQNCLWDPQAYADALAVEEKIRRAAEPH